MDVKRRPLRVAVLAHLGGNIGHDMMGLGAAWLLRKAFPRRLIEVRWIEQHQPFSIYPKWHPWRILDTVPYWALDRVKRWANRKVVARVMASTVSGWVKHADLAIACGGPNLVHHADSGTQVFLMMHQLHEAFRQNGTPVANLSIGSCYPWEHSPAQMEERDIRFARRMFDAAAVTTVRDGLASKLAGLLNHHPELIPCIALLAGYGFESRWPREDYVVVNYQRMGANEDWNQGVDPLQWNQVLGSWMKHIRRHHRLVWVCHNIAEMNLVQTIAPGDRRVLPETLEAYSEVLQGAIAGIANRVHAAVAMASVGVPAFTVGTDSRLGVLTLMGLPVAYVKDVTVELITETMDKLIATRRYERERLRHLRTETAERYADIIRACV